MTPLKKVTDSYFGGYVGVLLKIELGVLRMLYPQLSFTKPPRLV